MQGRLPEVSLPRLQAAILVSTGLQRQPIEAIAGVFGVPVPQALALFNKAVRKMTTALSALQERDMERQLDARAAASAAAVAAGGSGSSAAASASSAVAASAKKAKAAAAKLPSDDEGNDSDSGSSDSDSDSGSEAAPVLSKAAQAALLADPELAQYAVPQDEGAWKDALAKTGGKPGVAVSVRKPESKSDKKRKERPEDSKKDGSGGVEYQGRTDLLKGKDKAAHGGSSSGGGSGHKKARK